MIHHFITKKKDQKTNWAQPYFCFGRLLQSAIVRSFTQLHLSRNSGFRGSLERIKLHFIARYTRWLIKKAKKCEQLSRVFVGMENFTFREMPLGEMLIETHSVSVFCRLLLWKFVEISKYVFCTAQNIYWSMIWLFIIIITHFRIFKVSCYVLLDIPAPECDNFGFYRQKILPSRFKGNINSYINLKKRCYYSENKTKIMLSLSLTAIEHFHAELHQTNTCGATRGLFVGIIQARCSCCLLNNNFRIFWRSLCEIDCFDRKIPALFFKHSRTTCKSTSLSIKCCWCWIA